MSGSSVCWPVSVVDEKLISASYLASMSYEDVVAIYCGTVSELVDGLNMLFIAFIFIYFFLLPDDSVLV